MSDKIRILVVDDHALVRGTVAECLAAEPGFHIAGTAASADEAIQQAVECQPDVILMDIDMPGLICFDAATTIESTNPKARIVFLSSFLHDWYIERALEVGARGYLTKREPPEAVIAAVRTVAGGGICFSEEVRSRLTLDANGARLTRTSRSRASTLTAREMEVLRYIAKGLSKKEIATTMHLSVKTIDRHCFNLMTKLDIHDRVELARYAIREGLMNA